MFEHYAQEARRGTWDAGTREHGDSPRCSPATSVNQTLEHYRTLLHAQQENRLELAKENLDTGSIPTAATYKLSDQTYAELVEKTSGKSVSDALRRDLLAYYADLEKPFAWDELIKELNTLKSVPMDSVSGRGGPAF